MKKNLLIVSIIFMFGMNVKSQNVNIFAGVAVKHTIIYGLELRSNNYGFFVERYANKIDYPVKTIGLQNLSQPSMITYDGLMIGVNKYIECLSKITMSVGVGILNEYNVYKEDNGVKKVVINEKFAIEMGVGKYMVIKKHLVIGVKGGVNNLTSIFGNVSVGIKL
jgi:hypothetical protein